MKKVTTKASYDFTKCTGCYTCTYVCPFYVVTIPTERPLHCAVPPIYDEKRCLGCSNC